MAHGRTRLIAPLLATLVAGCATAGPGWHGPLPVAPAAAARGGFVRAPAGTAAAEPAARWWAALGDPLLDDVIARALVGSPDLAAAQARIAQARAALAETRSARVPSLGVGALAGEASLPGGLLGRDTRLSEQIYSDNFQASWELDLFGTTRRRIESAADRASAAEASAADSAVALSAQVAQVYVGLREQQASAALLDRQVDADQRLLDHARQRVAAGTAPAQSVDTALSALAQSRTDAATAHAQILIQADQLAVLCGAEPGTFDALAMTPAALPQVPAAVAVGDPARLLRHRPDIRAAEYQLAAANADLGARIADRLPKISFTGVLGLGGTTPGAAFNPGTLIALIVPQIKWTLFDGGRAAAQVRNARGARDEAEAHYRARVLAALGDAEAALARFGTARVALANAAQARDAAGHSAQLQSGRADAGTLSRADALLAERQVWRAQLALVAAQAQMTRAFIAVQTALGLGWERAEPPK